MLTWRAPHECPAEPEVVAKIERWLASSLARPSLVVAAWSDVRTEPDRRYLAQLRYEFAGAAYSRVLHGATCDAVAEATALILATLIDPEAVARAQADAGGAAAAEPQSAELPPRAPQPIASAPSSTSPARRAKAQAALAARDRSAPLRWSLAALSWGGAGVLPDLAFGVGATAALSRGSFTLALDFNYWTRQRLGVDAASGAGATFDRLGGALRGSYHLLTGKVSADAYAGGSSCSCCVAKA